MCDKEELRAAFIAGCNKEALVQRVPGIPPGTLDKTDEVIMDAGIAAVLSFAKTKQENRDV